MVHSSRRYVTKINNSRTCIMQSSPKMRYVYPVEHQPSAADAPKSQALLNAIKEYETNKWKVIGAKVGKPAKVESFGAPYQQHVADFPIGMRAIC
jgi:hypothetical protein